MGIEEEREASGRREAEMRWRSERASEASASAGGWRWSGAISAISSAAAAAAGAKERASEKPHCIFRFVDSHNI